MRPQEIAVELDRISVILKSFAEISASVSSSVRRNMDDPTRVVEEVQKILHRSRCLGIDSRDIGAVVTKSYTPPHFQYSIQQGTLVRIVGYSYPADQVLKDFQDRSQFDAHCDYRIVDWRGHSFTVVGSVLSIRLEDCVKGLCISPCLCL